MASTDGDGRIIEQDAFEDLEQRYAMYCLLMIDEYPGSIKSDIAPDTDPKRNTIYSRIQYLISMGYVRYMNVNGKPTKRLQTTEKGRRVAECIRSIQDIIGEYPVERSHREYCIW